MRCAHWRRVPLDLMREVQERSADTCVDSAVQCQLSAHAEGAHYGFAGDLGEYGTAQWVRWTEMTAVDLVVLRDCPAIAPGPDGDACCLFADHVGRHTWEDTPEEVSLTG